MDPVVLKWRCFLSKRRLEEKPWPHTGKLYDLVFGLTSLVSFESNLEAI